MTIKTHYLYLGHCEDFFLDFSRSMGEFVRPLQGWNMIWRKPGAVPRAGVWVPRWGGGASRGQVGTCATMSVRMGEEGAALAPG